MKPKFSILTLMGITAYVAVNIAAFTRPESHWSYALGCIWLVIVVMLLVDASRAVGEASASVNGMFAGTVCFAIASALQYAYLMHLNPPRNIPQSLMLSQINLIAMLDASLVCGYVMATLARWHYRRQERRAKLENIKPTPILHFNQVMGIRPLTNQEYLATFHGKMSNVTNVDDGNVDIWPYVAEVKRCLEISEYAIEHRLVAYVYRSEDTKYDHVLIPYGMANAYLVVIVDLIEQNVYGHYLLDLNEEYGVGYAST